MTLNASLLTLAALLALLLLVWLGGRLRRGWRALLNQAQGLAEGRPVELDESGQPRALRSLARHLNGTARRLRAAFTEQAAQVAELQRQAQVDPVSGLQQRVPFIAQLQQQLAQPGPGAALLLVRLQRLEALNARIGRDNADRLLAQLASVLLSYTDRVRGTFAGRLNGSDLALCLPVAGIALETAQSLRSALLAVPALRGSGAALTVAGVDNLPAGRLDAGAALAAADTALAHAEHAEHAEHAGHSEHAEYLEHAGHAAEGGHGNVVVDSLADGAAAPNGAGAWREQIASALDEGRTQLAETPVLDAGGRLVHLACSLRAQLLAGGAWQDAGRWLALARRSRLLPQADLAAVSLVLQAIAADGRPRAVPLSAVSLGLPGVLAQLGQRLAAAPAAARLLSLECSDATGSQAAGAQPGGDAALAAAIAAWRPLGVTAGARHAGAPPQHLPALQAAGVRWIKVDARHLRGAGVGGPARDHAQGLLALVHGLQLQALADGVDDDGDLAALWALGFDGAAGPALLQR